MHPSPESQPRQRRSRVRLQARLDTETHAKLEAPTRTFHRQHAAILRYVMQWGLTHTTVWIIDLSIPDRPHLVHMLLDRELLQQVQNAADAHGVTVAAWIRHAMRQVTIADFPQSWRAEGMSPRSPDSGYFRRKFGLRLDEAASRKLAAFMHTFERSAAETIRELIAQATPEDFPTSWKVARREHRQEKHT